MGVSEGWHLPIKKIRHRKSPLGSLTMKEANFSRRNHEKGQRPILVGGILNQKISPMGNTKFYVTVKARVFMDSQKTIYCRRANPVQSLSSIPQFLVSICQKIHARESKNSITPVKTFTMRKALARAVRNSAWIQNQTSMKSEKTPKSVSKFVSMIPGSQTARGQENSNLTLQRKTR